MPTFTTHLLLVLFALFSETVPVADSPIPVKFTGQVIGNIDQSGFPEPSGIVFHPTRKTLFVVGDEGDLCEMRTDGTLLRKRHYASGSIRMDFEGVTVNPLNELLYIAVEGAETILEIDPEDLAIKRQFDIERILDGELLMAPGGQGIEGIAFIPNPEHPHGGTFLVANQTFSLNDTQDISAVFEVEAPLGGDTGLTSTCRPLRKFSPGITDLSDMHYDTTLKRLYIISDQNNLLLVTKPDGNPIAVYTELPCSDQEGITFDENGNIYIAQDSGGVIKIKWTDKE